MKKVISLLCAAMLCLGCLAACGDKPETPDTGNAPVSQSTKPSATPILPGGNNDAAGESQEPAPEPVSEFDEITDSYFADTYWVAVEFVSTESQTEVNSMPWETWNVDIILYAEGGAKFRSVMYDAYTEGARMYSDSFWYVDEDTDELQIGLYDAETLLFGKVSNGDLYIDYSGGTLRFERGEEMPTNGDEWCPADLVGTWALETHEIEGYGGTAEEFGLIGPISFFAAYPGLVANFVNHDAVGNETSVWNAPVVRTDLGLYDGGYNTRWTVMFELEPDDISYKRECWANMTDRNTLEVMIFSYFEGEEYPTVCFQTYSWQGEDAVG